MDPNLLHWKTHGQSFRSRLQTWMNLLDPMLLLASGPEIQEAHRLLQNEGKLSKEDESALTLSLSSVHADSGAALPLVFRPPAVFPISAPLVVASLLPHSTVKPALFWQLLLQSYYAGFNFANRNSSTEQQDAKTSSRQLLLMAGTVSYTVCGGAFPQILINRLRIRNPPILTFCKFIVPVPLSAAVAFLNVFTIRSEESESGIQVFDTHGNLVGVSKAAGQQAVRQTAVSRAVLIGMTSAVSNLLILLLRRRRLLKSSPLMITSFHYISTILVLGLMLPVTFSLFPQLGRIKRERLEEELQAAAEGGHLFFHRGL